MVHSQQFETMIRANPDLMYLLARLRTLRLPQWRLVAGCLYQTVWNCLTGRPRGTGIKDYDLAYYDTDLSWEAEDVVIQRVAAATRDCVGPIETRNQARVHLWFSDRFGVDYPRLSSTDESLGYYASVTHAVGIRLEDDGRIDLAAPFGLDDVFDMVIRPNYGVSNRESFAAKAERAKAIWPAVRVIGWEDTRTAV